ncbi:hypothetical protein DFQ27_009882 [Actinomortierella ambigua]|uniref:Uncharacterized protein n=1 Tax=Actinomortierella ambigua TaxID=1343610 RepID=A0A9P6TWW1_9FUNG|nr:hypothetical protein DFQ27_009882 [Actinomortierella ambigua]
MQLKALLVSAVAVAAVSAQTFEKGACSECVFKTLDKNAVCAKLPAEDLKSVNTLFADPAAINATQVAALIQKEAVKACLCDWVAPTANSTSSCSTGAPAACTEAQAKAVNEQLAAMGTNVLKCAAAPGGGNGGNSTTSTSASGAKPSATSPSAGPSPTKSAASMANVPYALAFALVGVAAFFGY